MSGPREGKNSNRGRKSIVHHMTYHGGGSRSKEEKLPDLPWMNPRRHCLAASGTGSSHWIHFPDGQRPATMSCGPVTRVATFEP